MTMRPMSGAPDTIRRYLDEHVLQVQVPTREEIESLLAKATTSASDATQPGLSASGAVQLGFQAQLQATMALLRTYGYRTVQSDKAHHFRLIDSVRVLAKEEGEDALAAAMLPLDRLRSARARSIYEQEMSTPEEGAQALREMQQTLASVHGFLEPRLARIPAQQRVTPVAPPATSRPRAKPSSP